MSDALRGLWPPGMEIIHHDQMADPTPFPGPSPEMMESAEFKAVWECIKRWDINVPDVYCGYCGANGSHVRAILDALASAKKAKEPPL